MVGLIQTILLDLVQEQAGPSARAEVRKMANVPEEHDFRIDEVYDDGEFQRLFAATCERLGLTTEQAIAAFSRAFYEDSLTRWPMWFQLSKDARSFLKRQPAIHNGFASGVSDSDARTAIRDKFALTEESDRLIVKYKSPNKLCGVYTTLAGHILEHYKESASVEHPQCMHRGDDACEIHVIWPDAEGNA